MKNKELQNVFNYLIDALASSQEPWLREAQEVCKSVLEKLKNEG